MSLQNVAFVLVPGSFATTAFYDNVTPILEAKGYTVVPTELQSAGLRNTKPAATFEDDARHIRSNIVELLEKGQDVVLGLSSYSGCPGSEAIKGLSRSERGEGNGGAVIGLVYFASFLPPVGASLADMMGMPPEDPNAPPADEWMERDVWALPDKIFSDISSTEERAKHFDRMVDHSAVSFRGKLTHAGYKHIPTTFMVATADQVVPPALQYAMIEAANKDGANITTVEIDGSHAFMLTQPEKTVEVLLSMAGEKA